jgi:hypothetical protein
MTHPDEVAAMDRMRRALLAFQRAQGLLLRAERQLKGEPQTAVDAFWADQGRRIEVTVADAAQQVMAAFAAFSSAGLVAEPADRHLVTEAKRTLAEGKG